MKKYLLIPMAFAGLNLIAEKSSAQEKKTIQIASIKPSAEDEAKVKALLAKLPDENVSVTTTGNKTVTYGKLNSANVRMAKSISEINNRGAAAESGSRITSISAHTRNLDAKAIQAIQEIANKYQANIKIQY